jgi:hypothetical protein
MLGTLVRFSRIVAAAALAAGLTLACTGKLLEPAGAAGAGPADPSGSGGANGSGAGGTAGAPGTEIKNCTLSTTGHVGLQRLTSSQIANTLTELLGVPVTLPDAFPRDDRLGNYVTLPDAQLMSSVFVEQQLDLALRVVDQAVQDTGNLALFVCDLARAECPRELISRFVLRAFRRPPLDAEIESYVGLYGRTQGTPQQKLADALTAIVTSPQFLYRELWSPTPNDPARSYALNDYELATRLSYFLWDSMPDQALFDAAAGAELSDPARFIAQVERMLADPKARGLARSIADQWLGIGALWNVPDKADFPEFDDALRAAMYAETERFVQYLLRENRPLAELVDAPYTFAGPELGEIYGAPGADPSAPAAVPHRRGILGHASVLSLTSAGSDSSIVRRGLWVNQRLLCREIPDPPANVNTSLTNVLSPTATQKQKLDEHRKNPDCATCHNMIDPPGIALESFGALGQFRSTYPAGQPVETSGTLITGESFTDAAALAQVIAQQASYVPCVAKRIAPIAVGRMTDAGDCMQQAFAGALAADFGFRDLVLSIVTAPMFRTQGGKP